MTDEAIIQMALLRYRQICDTVHFSHGEFDIYLPQNETATGIVRDNRIEYIVIPNGTLGCKRRIAVRDLLKQAVQS